MIALFLTHPLDWLLHDGIGQNIAAGAITVALGFAWSRTKYWPLHAVHVKLDALHRRHEELHAKHDALADHVRALHERRDDAR